jgi:hypothetical protein
MACLVRSNHAVWVPLCITAIALSVGFVGTDAYSSTGGATKAEGRAATPAPRPLHTAFLDPFAFAGPEGATSLGRARRAGAKYVRVLVSWTRTAPNATVRPAGFDPRNPGDPRYNWTQVDSDVRAALAHGLTPFIYMQGAPAWAENGQRGPNDGPVRPSPAALGDFATAMATRFGGNFGGLPRVRYWQVWNEPNLNIQLAPQTDGGRPVSPDWYRDMVNAVAGAVHAVRSDNVVIAGGLAPFGGTSNDPSGGVVPGQERIRPLQFMRQMLCMSGGAKPRKTCAHKTEFDIWAHHPYTYGGPTRSAFHADDVSLGDLSTMRGLFRAAQKAGQIKARKPVDFWVTEFSYDSQPADPKGLSLELHARFTSEALYRMWTNGVTLVTWFFIRDEPFPNGAFQSGLYIRGPSAASDIAKPALRSFRFPFVAFKAKNKPITYWGRSPSSARAKVVLEQRVGKRWKRVSTLTTNRYGIFTGKLTKAPGRGPVRARLANGKDFSHGFSLRPVKDVRFCPWGSFC